MNPLKLIKHAYRHFFPPFTPLLTQAQRIQLRTAQLAFIGALPSCGIYQLRIDEPVIVTRESILVMDHETKDKIYFRVISRTMALGLKIGDMEAANGDTVYFSKQNFNTIKYTKL